MMFWQAACLNSCFRRLLVCSEGLAPGALKISPRRRAPRVFMGGSVQQQTTPWGPGLVHTLPWDTPLSRAEGQAAEDSLPRYLDPIVKLVALLRPRLGVRDCLASKAATAAWSTRGGRYRYALPLPRPGPHARARLWSSSDAGEHLAAATLIGGGRASAKRSRRPQIFLRLPAEGEGPYPVPRAPNGPRGPLRASALEEQASAPFDDLVSWMRKSGSARGPAFALSRASECALPTVGGGVDPSEFFHDELKAPLASPEASLPNGADSARPPRRGTRCNRRDYALAVARQLRARLVGLVLNARAGAQLFGRRKPNGSTRTIFNGSEISELPARPPFCHGVSAPPLRCATGRSPLASSCLRTGAATRACSTSWRRPLG